MAAPEIDDLSPDERDIVTATHDWVKDSVLPVAHDLEHANAYPAELIETMKQLGVFGLVIPERYGGAGVSTACFALVTEELARGWMSLAGAMGGHSVVARMITMSGTDEQKDTWLPRMATGQVRAAMALTEPAGGSDLQAIRTRATPAAGGYRLDGVKTWITNARAADMIAVLCKTDPDAVPGSRGISVLLADEGARLHRLPRPAQARLQGRRDLRARLRRLSVPGRCAARRAGGRRVRPDDGRA